MHQYNYRNVLSSPEKLTIIYFWKIIQHISFVHVHVHCIISLHENNKVYLSKLRYKVMISSKTPLLLMMIMNMNYSRNDIRFFHSFVISTEHLTGCTNFIFTHFTFLDHILSQLYLFLSTIFSSHIILQILWVLFRSGYAIKLGCK